MLNDATTATTTGEFMSRIRLVAGHAPRLAVICLVLLLAVPTGIVAVTQGLGAIPLPFNLHLVDQRLPGIFKLHMLASGAALLLIPAVIALRRNSAWHRPLGLRRGRRRAARRPDFAAGRRLQPFDRRRAGRLLFRRASSGWR